MAIAFVAGASTDGGASNIGSITVTVATGAGADFIAFGAIQYAANTITAVTINGVDVSANVIQADFATAGKSCPTCGRPWDRLALRVCRRCGQVIGSYHKYHMVPAGPGLFALEHWNCDNPISRTPPVKA